MYCKYQKKVWVYRGYIKIHNSYDQIFPEQVWHRCFEYENLRAVSVWKAHSPLLDEVKVSIQCLFKRHHEVGGHMKTVRNHVEE